MNGSYCLSLVAAFAISTGPLDLARCDNPSPRDVEPILTASAPRELAEGYAGAFSSANSNALQQLTAHPNYCISFAAGWEQVRRATPRERQGKDFAPLPAEAISPFLTLIERRTQIRLPPAWADAIKRAHTNDSGIIWFPRAEKGSAGDKVDAVVGSKEGQVTVTKNGTAWSIPGDRVPIPAFLASVELTDETAYIAIYGEPPLPFALHAVDKSSRQIRWSSGVWTGGQLLGITTGKHWHRVSISVHDGKVFIFGAAAGLVYIEIFDAKTGKTICRFGSAYFVDS